MTRDDPPVLVIALLCFLQMSFIFIFVVHTYHLATLYLHPLYLTVDDFSPESPQHEVLTLICLPPLIRAPGVALATLRDAFDA